MPNIKIQETFLIAFYKTLKNKWYYTKVLPKRFHLNGHTVGFCPQTQKLELHYILCFADTAAILILPPAHPMMIIEINIFLYEQLISLIIMGCPGSKISMAAVSAKQSMSPLLILRMKGFTLPERISTYSLLTITIQF